MTELGIHCERDRLKVRHSSLLLIKSIPQRPWPPTLLHFEVTEVLPEAILVPKSQSGTKALHRYFASNTLRCDVA